MRKTYFIIYTAFVLLFLTNCGQNNKELRESRIADSIRIKDSITKVQDEEQRIKDSIANSEPMCMFNFGENTEVDKRILTIEKVKFADFFKSDESLPNSAAVFEIGFTAKNNSNFKYSSILFDGYVILIMKDGIRSEDHAQWSGQSNYIYFKNVNPLDSMKVSFQIDLCQKFSRTPEKALLFVEYEAMSVDSEVKDTLCVYNVLPEWIAAQKQYGFR